MCVIMMDMLYTVGGPIQKFFTPGVSVFTSIAMTAKDIRATSSTSSSTSTVDSNRDAVNTLKRQRIAPAAAVAVGNGGAGMKRAKSTTRLAGATISRFFTTSDETNVNKVSSTEVGKLVI